MIIGIGVDIIDSTRIDKLWHKFTDKFLTKIYTDKEIASFRSIKNHQKKILFLAKRFAAKESFSKACGIGIGRGINFKDIEITNDYLGKPNILIINNKITFLNKIFNCKNFIAHLSLSDEGNLVNSYVIIEK